MMRVGFVQMTPVFGDREHNLATAERLIRSAGADLLVLPEFFASGYLFLSREEVVALSESIEGGPTTSRLLTVSRQAGAAIVAGIPERDGEVCYNSAVLVTPDGDIHRYRKTHLFDREKLFFAPGNSGFRVFSWRNIRIGIMICFDWFFPESMRTLALEGAQIIAHPSNLVLPHCPEAMVTRCLENRVFSITANRAGSESRGGFSLGYIGRSRIVSPRGAILGGAESEKTAVVTVEIDPEEADAKRINERNDLFDDRRPSMYRVS